MTAAVARRRPMRVRLDPIRETRHLGTAAAREFADWLSYLKVANKAPRTLDNYKRTVAALLIAFPDKRLAEFTPGDILQLLATYPAKSRHLNRSAQEPKASGGDPVEVHPPDSRAESQAELNGPSGSPTSPPERALTRTPQELAQTVRECLDLGLQSWRTTRVAPKFLTACDNLNALVGRVRELEAALQQIASRELVTRPLGTADGVDYVEPMSSAQIARTALGEQP